MSPLYRRLLLVFCVVNVITLLVSVTVTEGIVSYAYGGEVDWGALAQAADAAYIKDGKAGLAEWSAGIRKKERVEVTLFEDGHNLLDWPLLQGQAPPPEPAQPPPQPDAGRPEAAAPSMPGAPPPRGSLPVLGRMLPQLLNADSIVLRPRAELLLAGQRVIGSDGVARQMVAVRGPRPPRFKQHVLLAVQIVLSVLAIGAVGWRVARGIARPVAALQQAAQRMAAGDLSARVGGRYPLARDELGLLAREFDHMAGRIEALVAHERGVLQDVSHELRSPLARLQLILELARQEAGAGTQAQFERAEHEISRLDMLIGELLTLSRMEADLPGMSWERVDLAALATECIAETGLEAQARDARLGLRAPEPLEVSGSPQLLARALENLLSNAIKFAGGDIEVRLQRSGRNAELSVRDHGPGVPAADLPKLFRPFFRGGNGVRVGGHGLGLAIVERVAHAHGGQVGAVNMPDGGLRVTLSLPLADAPA
ncbi:MAG: HAMP domain-containing sensor histidine kinase [Nevskia sp.]|nr:HAMP domain-containing sensor histidine kinase [Nevskia sp.]